MYKTFSMEVNIKWLRGGEPYGMAEVRTSGVRGKESAPIFVTCLLDISGSMMPHEEMLQKAVESLILLVPINTHMRFITFESEAKEIKPFIQISSDFWRDSLANWTPSIVVSSGMTNLHDALDLIQLQDGMNLVVLMSDGIANRGKFTKAKELIEVARQKGLDKCIFATIGFNDEQNLQLDVLQGLATETDGAFHMMKNEEMLHEAFGDVVGELHSLSHMGITGLGQAFHLRTGIIKKIPFVKSGNFVLKGFDVFQNCMFDKEIVVGEPPITQDTDYEVDEAFIMQETASLMQEFAKAKKEYIDKVSMLDPPAPARFGKRRAEFMEPLASELMAVYNKHVGMLRDQVISPVKTKIKDLIKRMDANPRGGVLLKLKESLVSLLSAELETVDAAVQTLALDTTLQRSMVRENSLGFDASPACTAGRRVTRHLSHYSASASEAQALLTQSMAGDNSA